jgi:hypothetical protein
LEFTEEHMQRVAAHVAHRAASKIPPGPPIDRRDHLIDIRLPPLIGGNLLIVGHVDRVDQHGPRRLGLRFVALLRLCVFRRGAAGCHDKDQRGGQHSRRRIRCDLHENAPGTQGMGKNG